MLCFYRILEKKLIFVKTPFVKKINRTDRQKVKDFFSSSSTPISFQKLSHLLGYEPYRFSALLKKDIPIDFRLLLAIYTVSGISPKQMGIENISFDLSHNPRILEVDEEPPIFHSYTNRVDDRENYPKVYLDSLRSNLKKSNRSIYVYDYFMNNPYHFSDRDRNRYFNGYRKYFEEIESLAEKKEYRYTRLIALPPHIDVLMPHSDLSKCPYDVKAMFLFFVETYEHLIRSFEKFGDRFKLYITDKRSRAYSVMIIDDTYLVSEYFRGKIGGKNHDKFINVPDLYFLEKAVNNNVTSRLLQTYKGEFKSVSRQEVSPLRLKTITEMAIKALDDILDKVSKSEIDDYEKLNLRESLVFKKNKMLEKLKAIVELTRKLHAN